MANAELMAATRDASFYRCPGRGGRYHAVAPGGGKALWSACGLQLTEFTEEPASGLLESEKCQKPACRKAFNAAAPKQGEG